MTDAFSEDGNTVDDALSRRTWTGAGLTLQTILATDLVGQGVGDGISDGLGRKLPG
jgi:hypothetical protein